MEIEILKKIRLLDGHTSKKNSKYKYYNLTEAYNICLNYYDSKTIEYILFKNICYKTMYSNPIIKEYCNNSISKTPIIKEYFNTKITNNKNINDYNNLYICMMKPQFLMDVIYLNVKNGFKNIEYMELFNQSLDNLISILNKLNTIKCYCQELDIPINIESNKTILEYLGNELYTLLHLL